MIAKIIGGAMLVTFTVGLVASMVQSQGWKCAIATLIASIMLTGWIILAIFLLVK